MPYSAEALAAHASLSQTSVSFLHHVEKDPAWLRRAEFDDLQGSVATELQPWPTFLGSRRRDQLKQAAVATYKLVKSVPQRVFGADVKRFTAFFGEADAEAFVGLLDDEQYLSTLIARGDYLLTETQVMCLEMNVGAALGGWEVVFVMPRLLAISPWQRFVAATGAKVDAPNSIAILFDHLLRRLVAEGRSLVIGISTPAYQIDPDPFRAYLNYEYAMAQARAGVSGGVVTIGLTDEFRFDEATATWAGADGTVGALMEYALPPPRDLRSARSLRERTTLVLNGPLAGPLGDKRCLALLSDHEHLDVTDQERATIDAHIPWTRILEDGRARFRGQEMTLPDLALKARGDLVLKRGQDYGGRGVYVGQETSVALWDEAVREALTSRAWVLQEYIQSAPFIYQSGEHGAYEHNAVWGVYMMGESYGGASVRVLPRDGSAVINVLRGAEKSVVLEVDD